MSDKIKTVDDEIQENSLWENNSIQFPRLICEIMATVNIDEMAWEDLKSSMDLETADLNELFYRAHIAWEAIKRDSCPRYHCL